MSAVEESVRMIRAHKQIQSQRDNVTAMRQSGMAEDAIAEAIGVSRTTIHYALAFWGVKVSKGEVHYRKYPPRPQPRSHCSECGELLQNGECSVCALFAEEPTPEAYDDRSFWGPLLPPVQRAAREGPPLCEVLEGS